MVIATFVAGYLGWRYSRPPEFVASAAVRFGKVNRGLGDTFRNAAAYQQVTQYLWTPREDKPVTFTCVVIVPSVAGTLINAGWRNGVEEWQSQCNFGIRVVGTDNRTITPKMSVVLVYDARHATVSLGNQSVPVSPSSIYVIQIDDQWHPHLTASDSDLDLPGVAPDVLEDLRAELQK